MIAVSAILFLVCNTARPHRVMTLCGGVKNACFSRIFCSAAENYFHRKKNLSTYVGWPRLKKTGNTLLNKIYIITSFF